MHFLSRLFCRGQTTGLVSADVYKGSSRVRVGTPATEGVTVTFVRASAPWGWTQPGAPGTRELGCLAPPGTQRGFGCVL